MSIFVIEIKQDMDSLFIKQERFLAQTSTKYCEGTDEEYSLEQPIDCY